MSPRAAHARTATCGLALLLLAAWVPRPARAQAATAPFRFDSLTFRGIGAEVGRAWARDLEAAPIVTLRGNLGPIRPSLFVMPVLGFWDSRVQPSQVRALARQYRAACVRAGSTDCPEVDLGTIQVSDLFLGVDLEYQAARTRRLRPFASLGGALHLLNGQGEAIAGTFVERLLDAISPGLSTALGVELRVFGPLRLRAGGSAALASATRFVSLSLGGTVALPVRAVESAPLPSDSVP